MIRKLRLKFIAIIALIMSIILVVEIVCINVVTRKIGMMQTESYLSQIATSVQFDDIDGIQTAQNLSNISKPEEEESGTAKVYSQSYLGEDEAYVSPLSVLENNEDYYTADEYIAAEDGADLNDEYYGPYPFGESPWYTPPVDDYWGYDHWHEEEPVYEEPATEAPTVATPKATEAPKAATQAPKTTKKTVTTKKTTTKKTTTSAKEEQQKVDENNDNNNKNNNNQDAQEPNGNIKDNKKNTEASESNDSSESSTEESTDTTESSDGSSDSSSDGHGSSEDTPGQPPDKKIPKQEFNDNKNSVTVDYFAIVIDENDDIYRVANLKQNDTLTDSQIQYLAYTAINSDKTTAIVNNYQYYKAAKNYGYVLVYTNKSSENALMRKMLMISIFVTLIAMIILLGIAVILSNWTVKPVKEAFSNQKQFISDASHELKTPLTVISANADLLEEEIGENKWLGYIKGQTERMRTLVYELLDLSRMDSAHEPQKIFEQFCLSEAVTNATLPFESAAFEQEKNLQIDIKDHILYTGNEKQIKQLTAIFIDNALKYSNDHGNIRVTLKKDHEKPVLEFFNTGCTIKDDEREKIFERFYRSDSSRARQTGGYGLGLAIAKSIMDTHKMKFTVDSVENAWIKFTITM